MLRTLFVMLLTVGLAAAQTGEEEAIRVNVDLVNVYLTVCTHRGRLITNLNKENFAVTEDGAPQVVTHFSRETDVPLKIVLLIDVSGSVKDKLAFERAAATQFLYSTLRPEQDKAALITFDDGVEVRQDYTDDPAVLSSALNRVVAGGGTRLYDALHFAVERTLSGSDERKVVILITDGDDKSSIHTPQEVLDAAHRNGVSIYTISVNGVGIKWGDTKNFDNILRLLAAQTGGTSFFPTKSDRLAANFRKITDELRSQYSIGYRSTNQRRDGTFRKIWIDTTRGHYSIRTRAGYYAPLSAVTRQ